MRLVAPASTNTAMTLPANIGDERSWTTDVTLLTADVMSPDIADVIDAS